MKRLKRWIINRSFVQQYVDEQTKKCIDDERMNAFKFAHADVLETVQSDIENKAEELALKKLNDLLSNCDLSKIVTVDKRAGVLFIGGKQADDAILSNLQAEAKFFEESELWNLIYNTPKLLAERAMFIDSESLDGLRKGRSILYTLSTQKNILNVIKTYVPKQ